MAAELRLSGSADVGGRFGAPSFDGWSTDQPAFWSLVLFAALVLAVIAVVHALR